MLYIALIVAAIQFLIVNLIAWKAKHPVLPIWGTAFFFVFVVWYIFVNFGFAPIPVLFQSVLLLVLVSIWGGSRGRPRYFLLFSTAGTLVLFGIPSYHAFQRTRFLLEAFPYVSMDDRLPQRKQLSFGALPPATSKRLAEAEKIIEDMDQGGGSLSWKSSLRQIHEDTVQLFVDQPGFGESRVGFMKEQLMKNRSHPDERFIQQPSAPSPSIWLEEQLQNDPMDTKTSDELLSFHFESVRNFADPFDFGYIKDRRRVVGFQEHHFTSAPEPAQSWKLQMLELIGLVLHEKPTAYISDHLPRMKELRAAPTRALDEFESVGLDALQRGDDLFVRARGRERRMLGAIRAARQCLSCHQSERGDLLGAFSYRMTVDGK